MPDIEISSAQLEALEALQDALADQHVGAYGTVRPRDAIQYLLDYHEADGAGAVPEAADATSVIEVEPSDGADHEVGADAETAEVVDDEAAESADDADDDADPDDRLEAMMNLMSEHEDKWEISDSDEGGKYVVELPDGKSMHVRTKDDVRGLLFKHYG